MKKFFILSFLFLNTIVFSQSWQWIKRGGSEADPDINTSRETITAMETDSQGNVFMVAPVNEYAIDVSGNPKTGYGNRDNVISSFSCDGTYRWSTVVGAYGNDYIYDLKVDSMGDVYVVMFIQWPNNQFEELFHFDATTTLPFSETFENRKRLYIAKYSGTTGNVIWFQSPQIDGLTNYSQGVLSNLDIDAENNLYILASLDPGTYCNGALVNSTPGNRKYILKYNNNGGFISASQPIEFSGSIPFFKRNPVNGKFYITNYFTNLLGATYSDSDTLRALACFSPNGTFEWMKSVQNSQPASLDIRNLQIDVFGNLYITGHAVIGGTFDSYTISSTVLAVYPFLLKLNPDGNVIWGTNATITPANNNFTYVGINNNNEVVVSPYFHSITWGGSLPNNGSNGGQDASLWRFNKTTGAFIDNTRLTSSNGYTESVTAITSDIHNNFYVGGYFQGNIIANSTTLNSVGGSSDFFVAKYGSSDCTLSVEEQQEQNKTMVYPNPAYETVFINIKEQSNFSIYNVMGKKVASGIVENAQQPIPISNLAKGSYIIQIKNSLGTSQSKFIKN